MYIDIGNSQGNISFTPANFDTFRTFVVTGQKIQAIKHIRTVCQSWGLKEAKDFVEACDFGSTSCVTPAPYVAPGRDREFNNFLFDLKDDLRSLLISGKDCREGLLVDLFARVCALVARD